MKNTNIFHVQYPPLKKNVLHNPRLATFYASFYTVSEGPLILGDSFWMGAANSKEKRQCEISTL